MAITIGRAGGALAPLNPDSVSEDARGIQVAGRFAGTTTTLTRMVAQMIPGLNGVDEPVVPVLFDEDADLNGFYRVRSASVDLEPDSIVNRHFRWSVSLDAVVDRAAPQVDHILDTVLRTNTVSITAAGSEPWVAFPVSTGITTVDAQITGGVVDYSPVTETGSVTRWNDNTNVPPRREVARTVIRPEHWYRGAATVERQWGADWVPVIGRQAVPGDPTGVMGISNGVVRMRLHPTDPTRFLFSCWDGAWESETEVRLQVWSNPAFSPIRFQPAATFTIIRNSPEEVRVRISGVCGTAAGTVDMRLRRGSPIIEIRWASALNAATLGRPQLLDITPVPSWTATTGGGARMDAVDGSGNRLVQCFPIASSNTTLGNWSTALGFLTGTWWAAFAFVGWNDQNIRNQYFASTAESARIVGA